MDFDGLFSEFDDTPSSHCNCGRGYCASHGTFHFSEETELLEIEQRQQQLFHRGTNGGIRVVKKEIGGDK
jgi:hypothetical protein